MKPEQASLFDPEPAPVPSVPHNTPVLAQEPWNEPVPPPSPFDVLSAYVAGSR